MNTFFSQKIQQQLNRREVVKWSGGQDYRGFANVSKILFYFGFSWLAFTLLFLASAFDFKMPKLDNIEDFIPFLLGSPFILIGIALLLSPLFIYFRAKNIVYVITNQRAFELYCGRVQKIKIYLPDQIDNIVCEEQTDGRGNLYLVIEEEVTHRGIEKTKRGFIGIKDVKRVELYIYKLKQCSREE